MKKFLFFLLAFISVSAFAEVDDTALFDFTNPKQLTISPAVDMWDGSFDDQGVIVTSKAIISKDIQISFTLGTGVGGVMIPRYSLTYDGKPYYYYALEMRAGSTITIRTTNGCDLVSVKLNGSLGSLTNSSTGVFDGKTGLWTATTKTDTVKIHNGVQKTGIETIEVCYKKPSKPLTFVSSNPSAGSEVISFNAMTLSFNMNINSSNFNANGITLSGPGISSPVAMTPSVSGTSVRLSTSQTYTAYGDYTVSVPAGAFKNSEGGSHESITIPFRVNPKRDILIYSSISPAEGTLNELPQSIDIIFKEFVSVPENSTATFYKDGIQQFTAKLALTEGNTKSVTISHSRGSITDEGVWTIVVPEMAIYNGMMGDAANERWNPAFTLTYKVESAEAQELAVAKQLKQFTDNGLMGYPTTSSAGYAALTTVINKGKEASTDEIKEAIGAYYNETNVKMPADGKWYRIAGISADGSTAYLSYDNQKVTLKSSYSATDAFQAVAGNGYFEFKTKDEHYLTVLGNPSGFDGFVYHQSGKATQLQVTKLQVENADSTELIGKFSISGWLGRNANDEDLGNSTAAVSYPSLAIVASPTASTFFSSSSSSAFIFEETSEPADPTTSIEADITFGNNLKGIEIEKAGDPITLLVGNVQSAELADGSLPYYEKQSQISNPERIQFAGTILTKVENSPYSFSVNTTGLEPGEYLLYVPAETFSYTPTSDYSSVTGTLTKLSITIKGSSSGQTPDPTQADITFDNNLKSIEISKAGDPITLVVSNVKSADIDDSAAPYFVKSGSSERVNTGHTVLTKIASTSAKFNVNTEGLAAGDYQLNVPAETFSYVPTSESSSVVGTSAQLNITIKASDPTTKPNFSYDYPFAVEVKYRMDPSVNADVVADVWLNDLIFFSTASSIVPNPDKEITINNINGALVKTGHLEAYPNYKKDLKYDWLNGTVAVKLVLDNPFTENELKYLSGMYYVTVPSEALGDANFGKWLKDNKFTGACRTNTATSFQFPVNNVIIDILGIDEVNAADGSEQKIYDLTGRRVENMKKLGVYIVNGKKIMVK